MIYLVVIISVIVLLTFRFKYRPLGNLKLKEKLVILAVAAFNVWIIVAFLTSWLYDVDFFEALYWTLILGLSLEPVSNPSPNIVQARWLFIVNGGISLFIVALIVTYIVENFIRKGIERMRGLGIDYSKNPIKDHVVIIGWNKATEAAYDELVHIDPGRTYLIIANEDKAPEINEFIDNLKRTGKDDVLRLETDLKISLTKAKIWDASAAIISLDDDSKTIHALLEIKHLIKERIEKRETIHKEEMTGREKRSLGEKLIVVVEAKRDENTPLIKIAGSEKQRYESLEDQLEAQIEGKYIRTSIVISRSLVGRLLASAIIEPGILYFLEDATSTTFGVIEFALMDASRVFELIGYQTDQPMRLIDLQLRLMEIKDLSKRVAILGIIPKGVNGRRLRLATDPDILIAPDDKLIVIKYTDEAIARKDEIPGVRIIGDSLAVDLNAYTWVNKGSSERLWNLNLRTGHITLIGWTEATESFISELEEIMDGERFGYPVINKTIIVASEEPIEEIIMKGEKIAKMFENVVYVRGSIIEPSTLRRAGITTADIIVLSTQDDSTLVHTLLHIKNLINEHNRMSRYKVNPVIIVGTQLSRTANVLMDNELADVTIPTKSFSGRLLAYAVEEPEVYSFIQDIISAAIGQGDLLEIRITDLVKHEIKLNDRENTITFRELYEETISKLGIAPIAIIKSINDGKYMVHIPDGEQIVDPDSNVVFLAPRNITLSTTQIYSI